eukprot:UN09751
MYLRNFFLLAGSENRLWFISPFFVPESTTASSPPVGPHHFRQVAYSLVWYCYLHVLQFVLPDRQCNRR